MSWSGLAPWNEKEADIIHLEVGDPDFDIPQCVKEAVCTALTDGHTYKDNSDTVVTAITHSATIQAKMSFSSQ
jgi:bifunctional pyridoxal-dependent enzyme with beta-cystathionase and maltose regulon repressor activities